MSRSLLGLAAGLSAVLVLGVLHGVLWGDPYGRVGVRPGAAPAASPPSTPSSAQAQAAGGMMAFSRVLHDSAEQLTLIDPVTRSVSVYHVEPATGKITLKSVRRLEWDLQLNAFNTADPQPLEVRSMVAPR